MNDNNFIDLPAVAMQLKIDEITAQSKSNEVKMQPETKNIFDVHPKPWRRSKKSILDSYNRVVITSRIENVVARNVVLDTFWKFYEDCLKVETKQEEKLTEPELKQKLDRCKCGHWADDHHLSQDEPSYCTIVGCCCTKFLQQEEKPAEPEVIDPSKYHHHLLLQAIKSDIGVGRYL